ncbi:uncharacterized protein LOC141852247 [Brevipalpus obovatus]|uniref:uncharacterized protein LOC141852247 n=1 Tax=Brevipalpus obovatus TaxID=246614 RepID=UPI003D9E2249
MISVKLLCICVLITIIVVMKNSQASILNNFPTTYAAFGDYGEDSESYGFPKPHARNVIISSGKKGSNIVVGGWGATIMSHKKKGSNIVVGGGGGWGGWHSPTVISDGVIVTRRK